jgi:hypothetical protein
MIVTYPKVYHSGFSNGFNINEAVNIVTTDWLPFDMQAIEDYLK